MANKTLRACYYRIHFAREKTSSVGSKNESWLAICGGPSLLYQPLIFTQQANHSLGRERQ